MRFLATFLLSAGLVVSAVACGTSGTKGSVTSLHPSARNARMVATALGQMVQYEASSDGRAFLYDRSAARTVVVVEMKKGQVLTLDPIRDTVQLGVEQVNAPDIKRERQYEIWFARSSAK